MAVRLLIVSDQPDAVGANETAKWGFSDVDAHPRTSMLLTTMDATARWDATRALRAFTDDALAVADSVLDVGCGLADVLISLAALGRPGPFVGLDASTEMIDEARRRADVAGVDVDLRLGDATALEFPDGQFDATRTERVLQWLSDPVTAIAEIVRVTKPGGWVVLIDSDWRTFASNVTEGGVLMRDRLLARPGGAIGGFLRSHAKAAGLVEIDHRVEVVVRTTWADDGSSGVPSIEAMVEGATLTHPDRVDEIARFAAEARRLVDDDDYFSTLTMVAVKGRVPTS
jgi:SAM-dependent methyltransferase